MSRVFSADRRMRGPLPAPERLAELRRRVRFTEHSRCWPDDWDRGSCNIVSEVVSVRYRNVSMDGGCYVANPFGMAGEPGTQHIAHVWNVVLSDSGTPVALLDVTADQFADVDLPPDAFESPAVTVAGVRYTDLDDPRYLATCDGESCDPI